MAALQAPHAPTHDLGQLPAQHRLHVLPHLGRVPLRHLRPDHLERLYSNLLATGHAQRAGGLANKTVLEIHMVLRRALDDAVRRGMLLTNPAAVAHAPKRRPLGTVSRQRWQDTSAWSFSEQECWAPLVPAELWQRANAQITNTRGSGTRRPRSEPGRYLFAGAIRCGHCGKAMFGAIGKNKPYYRCAATRPDYATPSVTGHPPTYSIREERILAAVDDWLATITDPDHFDATVEAILAADRASDPQPAEVMRARRQQKQLRTELDRMLAAIRAGMDPELAARETRKIQADIATAEAAIQR